MFGHLGSLLSGSVGLQLSFHRFEAWQQHNRLSLVRRDSYDRFNFGHANRPQRGVPQNLQAMAASYARIRGTTLNCTYLLNGKLKISNRHVSWRLLSRHYAGCCTSGLGKLSQSLGFGW